MPATIDMRLFWISIAAFFVVLHFAPKIDRHANDQSGSGRKKAILFIVVTALLGLVLCYPLTRWSSDDSVFGQLFSWFAAYGFAGLLFMRMSYTMLSCLRRKAFRDDTPSV
jgi:hypothetical protein